MSTPTYLSAWTSSSTNPYHKRLPARGMGPTGGRGHQVSTLKTINIILKTSTSASMNCPSTLLPPASTLVPVEVDQSLPSPAPHAPTQRPEPHALTLKTIKITLETSPPASTIHPATLLPSTSTSSVRGGVRPRSFLPPQLVLDKVEQSP